MIFLTMLSVILLSMLMILLYILRVIRHLICGNNLNRLLNLNLIYETMSTGGKKWLVDFNAGKKKLWPHFIDGVQLPQGYSHFGEARPQHMRHVITCI